MHFMGGIRLKWPVQLSNQLHHHRPDQLRIDFRDSVIAYRTAASTVRGVSLKLDPPGLSIRPSPEERITAQAVTKARVSADGDINSRIASVRCHSRSHASRVECLGHLLQGRRNHSGQADCGGLAEILLDRGLAGCLSAGLSHASIVVGEDCVKLLLDVFGHTRYPESTPCK